LGGVFANGENNDGIEVYSIRSNTWTEVDPTIENVAGEFGLLSCSGWAALNETQVFIFGGYNEEADS
jgi:N-acetylneuraminic acid mutarotase